MSVYFKETAGSSGSPYFATGTPTSAPVKTEHGVGGFLHNLGGDAVHAVEGLPMGLVETAAHPVRTVKQIGKSYAQTYGPLAHGDVSTFLHNVYTHPLGPIMDLATLVTGGAGLAAKAGLLSDEAATLEFRSPAALAAGEKGGDAAHVSERLTSTNPVIRARQVLVHKMIQKLPYDAPQGEAVKYMQQTARLPHQARQRLLNSPVLHEYNRAVRALSQPELAAMHLIGKDVHPLDYAAALHQEQAAGFHVEPAMFRVLESPKVIDAFENPNVKVMRAVDAADKLTKLDASVKAAHGQLAPETAAAHVGKFRQQVEAALNPEPGEPIVLPDSAPRVELRQTPGRPFYVPDVANVRRVPNVGARKMGGGATTPKNTVHMSRGVLMRSGRIVLNSDVIGPEFARTLKYGLADDLHGALMQGAARLSKEELQTHGLPAGWDFLPKDVFTRTGRRSAQAVGQARRWAEGKSQLPPPVIFPSATVENGAELADAFKVNDLNDAAQLHGDYLIVPTRAKNAVIGEFTRSSGAVRQFLDKPMKTWRALVLGARIGFLTNNVIGNHLLYAIHAAGIDGLRGYLNAVKRVKGESVLRSLVEMKGLPPALRDEFMREYFPEQVAGTFGHTQVPEIRSKLLQKAARLSTGIAPATEAVAERTLRRGLVETEIRRTPEFKAIYKAMPRETRDFETAAKLLLHGERGDAFQAHISGQVDNALGNYLNLSKFEQDTVRQILPFYAWTRAIARITLHLAIDTPGRADILAKLGQMGIVSTQEQLGNVPSYLLGDIPLGGGNVLSTSGANPFQSVGQLGQGIAGVLTGKPGQTGQALAELGPNPFLQAALNNLSGKDLFTGKTLTKGAGGLPGQVAAQVIQQLPQVRLAEGLAGANKPSSTYAAQTPRQTVLQYLGVPVRKLNEVASK